MESITPVSRPRFASIAAFLHHLNIRAAPRCDGSGGVAEFSIGVGGQVLTVREQRSKRDAMAAPRAAWESVHRTTEIWWRSSERRRVGIGTRYNAGDAG